MERCHGIHFLAKHALISSFNNRVYQVPGTVVGAGESNMRRPRVCGFSSLTQLLHCEVCYGQGVIRKTAGSYLPDNRESIPYGGDISVEARKVHISWLIGRTEQKGENVPERDTSRKEKVM